MGDNLELHLKLYYDFGGSPLWLKDEIIKKRYDFLRYLIPVGGKEDANTVVEIYSPSEDKNGSKYLSITSNKKIMGVVRVQKNICKNLCLTKDECNIIYRFLKKTYFEKF